jgi:hypothetical protein
LTPIVAEVPTAKTRWPGAVQNVIMEEGSVVSADLEMEDSVWVSLCVE